MMLQLLAFDQMIQRLQGEEYLEDYGEEDDFDELDGEVDPRELLGEPRHGCNAFYAAELQAAMAGRRC